MIEAKCVRELIADSCSKKLGETFVACEPGQDSVTGFGFSSSSSSSSSGGLTLDSREDKLYKFPGETIVCNARRCTHAA